MCRDRRSRVFALTLLVLILLNACPAVAAQAPPEERAAAVFSRLVSIAARLLGICWPDPERKPQGPNTSDPSRDPLGCSADPNGYPTCPH